MKSILTVLALVFAVPTFAQDLGDCGNYLDTLKTTTFKVDAPTQRDLNVKELVAPVIAKHVSTLLGHARLRWLLDNSTVKSDEVAARQRAVRFYVEHPNERARAKELLAAVGAAERASVADDLKTLAERDTKWKGIRDHVRSVVAVGAVGGVGSAIVVGALPYNAAFSLFMGLVFAGQGNEKSEEHSRKCIRPFVPMVKMIEQISADLASSEPSTLTEIRTRLDALLDPEQVDNLRMLKVPLERMRSYHLTSFGSVASMSNIFTARLRRKVVKHQQPLLVLASILGELDVIVALAEAATIGHHVFPTILDDAQPTTLSIIDGHHPWVYAERPDGSIPNTLELSAERLSAEPKFLLLTGPNTGGKSTYLKMIASLTLLAQMGGAVPAESMTLTPLALLTNMTAQDVLQDGHSFFYAQGQRVKEILDRAQGQPHVLILMDEILSGTSPEEHTAIEQAIIKFIVKSETISILATHDRKLQALEQTLNGVVNIHVDDKASETFRIKRGPSRHRNAIQVLREVGLPAEITDEAQDYLDKNLDKI